VEYGVLRNFELKKLATNKTNNKNTLISGLNYEVSDKSPLKRGDLGVCKV
jgi:hypothetical protein